MMQSWMSPIYAFYEPIPSIAYVDGRQCRQCHVFKCAVRGCKFTSRRYLDTKDRASTGNLLRHVKACWGEECWAAANKCHSAAEARESVTKPRIGTIPGLRQSTLVMLISSPLLMVLGTEPRLSVGWQRVIDPSRLSRTVISKA